MFEVKSQFEMPSKKFFGLQEKAEWRKIISIDDQYYDDPDFTLTRSKRKLLRHNGEFKLSKEIGIQKGIFQVSEKAVRKAIFNELKLSHDLPIEKALKLRNFQIIAETTKTRIQISMGDFGITFDRVILPFDKIYLINEIEMRVDREREIPEALSEISRFSRKHDLHLISKNGDLKEVLARDNPILFNLLFGRRDEQTQHSERAELS